MPKGWTRTLWLAIGAAIGALVLGTIGAFIGVFAVALIIHHKKR